MTRISWDNPGRSYSLGVDMGVLYPKNSPGVPWNGLVSVTEKGDDSSTTLYVDGQRYRTRLAPSNFSGVISAFTYPDEFEPYIGLSGGITAQSRPTFGISWRTNREIHLVYNALAAPSSDEYSTISDQVNPVTFEWDFSTLPVKIPGGRPTAHLVIMLDYAHADAIAALEDVIYGDSANDPSLPDPADLFNLFDAFATLVIVDNHDGTWTATGPDDVITMLDSDTFQIDWPSAIFINATSYNIHSL